MTFRDKLADGSAQEPVGGSVHVVRGHNAVLGMQGVLAEFSERCGQPGVLDDIGYFLSKPGMFARVPHLLLVSKSATRNPAKFTPDTLLGALLVYGYTGLGIGLGLYTTNDRSGRGTVVAPAEMRSRIASHASLWLLNRGALAVMISYRDVGLPVNQQYVLEDADDNCRLRWVRRERDMMEYLPLQPTYDATLAGIGQRTRRNLRYYRRLAEAQLGCEFVPHVKINRTEFLDFNRECMYAVPARVAAWRYELMKELASPLLMGARDANGRWLCLLGGRRRRDGTEILWQMNRDGLESYSLSIVMRSYFLEHEIQHGLPRLYMAGGTGHPIGRSFVREKVTDLVLLRRSLLGSLVPQIAKYFVPRDNDLAVTLVNPDLKWRSSERELLECSSARVSV